MWTSYKLLPTKLIKGPKKAMAVRTCSTQPGTVQNASQHRIARKERRNRLLAYTLLSSPLLNIPAPSGLRGTLSVPA